MARPIHHLGRFVSSALAVFVATATACAWAGDRYGPRGYDDQTEGYARPAADFDIVDPCAVQYHLTGRRCREQVGAPSRPAPLYRQPTRPWADGARESDPCAARAQFMGGNCALDRDPSQPREPIPYAALPQDRRTRDDGAWRGHGFYRDDRIEAREDLVDACAIVHQRRGDRCPYQEGYADYPVSQLDETLPDGFFIGDGGVGPGIVDFGGDGGGYAIGEGFAAASGSASASAHASASVSVSVMASITAHNHGGHYPPMHGGGWGGGGSWGGGKGGCGCKRGR